MIKLVNDTISHWDMDKMASWLKTYPRLTMGDTTREFEEAFSKWLGVKHSVFVNSGSSANLLMVYALKYLYGIKRVAVPALSWATDVSPLIQLGITPVLIDCNLENLSMDLNHLEDELKNGVDAVLFVSVLGLVPSMLELSNLCSKYGVYLIEDNCESMGSRQGLRKLGTYGVMSSHSLYFGHHISTIEGGLISTDDDTLYELLKMLRSHGWKRDLISTLTFDEMYTFYVPGFNVRSTDLQAFIGLLQLERLDDNCQKRFDNFNLYHSQLAESRLWTPSYRWFDFVSNMGFPVIYDEREWAVKRLIDNDVEVRPLIAGSMGEQPFYAKEYGVQYLANAHHVSKYGFYVPNHPDLTVTDIKRICRLMTTYA